MCGRFGRRRIDWRAVDSEDNTIMQAKSAACEASAQACLDGCGKDDGYDADVWLLLL
jgi:hypothetical protein